MNFKIALFYHSLVSDWNHGNAHFLRGICAELISRGHKIQVFEPGNSWSRANLIDQEGPQAERDFSVAYPQLTSQFYSHSTFDIEQILDGVNFVLVHEWNDPWLVKAIAAYRRRNPGIRIFFHDTHHRAISDPNSLDLENVIDYDGVLAYGESLREVYRRRGWANAHVWHEAADTRVFRPLPPSDHPLDIAWIGNWGDDERNAELEEFLIQPSAELGLRGTAHGVRYPPVALSRMTQAGLTYEGWLPNYRAPEVFARHRVTVHIPRRPYVTTLPGVPTIRPFEAMACGIPLVTARWRDTELLFREGTDFLNANSGAQMRDSLKAILSDETLRESLRKNGLETIARRHTCAHRVDELLEIYRRISPNQPISQNQQTPMEVIAR